MAHGAHGLSTGQQLSGSIRLPLFESWECECGADECHIPLAAPQAPVSALSALT